MSDPVKNESYAVLDENGRPTGKIVSKPPERGIQLDPPGALDPSTQAQTDAVRIASGDASPGSGLITSTGEPAKDSKPVK